MINADSPYWKKLQHPLWQEKRLRIMERAGFKCEYCGDSNETLQVHHRFYNKGAFPWEHSDECLVCFCDSCHKKAERIKKIFWKTLNPGDDIDLLDLANAIGDSYSCGLTLQDVVSVIHNHLKKITNEH